MESFNCGCFRRGCRCCTCPLSMAWGCRVSAAALAVALATGAEAATCCLYGWAWRVAAARSAVTLLPAVPPLSIQPNLVTPTDLSLDPHGHRRRRITGLAATAGGDVLVATRQVRGRRRAAPLCLVAVLRWGHASWEPCRGKVMSLRRPPQGPLPGSVPSDPARASAYLPCRAPCCVTFPPSPGARSSTARGRLRSAPLWLRCCSARSGRGRARVCGRCQSRCSCR